MHAVVKRNWPEWAGLCFFLVCQWGMGALLQSGRLLPPANDSFFYVFRIGRAMEGAWINDTSIAYTYLMAFLGNLMGADAFHAFEFGAVIGPLFAAAALWLLFRSLAFGPRLSGLAFLLIAFYCNIGPHTFLHFVPSTFAVILTLLWLALVVGGKPKYPFFAGFLVNTLLFLAHSSGFYVILVNLFLLAGIELRRKNRAWLPLAFWTVASLVVCIVALKLLPFEDLNRPLDQARWIQPDAQQEFGNVSGAVGYSFNPSHLLINEAKLAPWELWLARLYSYFFIFLFPAKKLAFVTLPLLGLLIWNSVRKPKSAIHQPYLWVFFITYFALFVGLSYSHERGARFIEYGWPLAFILLAVLLYDLPKLWLRAAATLGCVAYLAFVSTNFVITENARWKKLAPIPSDIQKELNEGVVFYTDNQSASYLLAHGLKAVHYIYLLPFFKRLNGPYYLAGNGDCPTEEPDWLIRRIFRKVSPRRSEPFQGRILNYAKQIKPRYEPWIGSVDSCLFIERIRF